MIFYGYRREVWWQVSRCVRLTESVWLWNCKLRTRKAWRTWLITQSASTWKSFIQYILQWLLYNVLKYFKTLLTADSINVTVVYTNKFTDQFTSARNRCVIYWPNFVWIKKNVPCVWNIAWCRMPKTMRLLFPYAKPKNPHMIYIYIWIRFLAVYCTFLIEIYLSSTQRALSRWIHLQING